MKILVGVPSYNKHEPRLTHSLLEAGRELARLGVAWDWCFPKVPFVDLARDMVAAVFLKGTYDYLVMTDDDLGWAPATLGRALDKLRSGGAEVTVALPPLREIHLDWCLRAQELEKGEPERYAHRFAVRPLPEDLERRKITLIEDGWARIDHAGLAWSAFARSAFEKLGPHSPDYATEDDPPMELTGYFTGALDTVKFGERRQVRTFDDSTFTRRWRKEVGGDLWLDTTARLSHTGPMTFEGRYGDTLT